MSSPLIPPLWLQDAIGHAERLGRNFEARELLDWEAETLTEFHAHKVTTLTSGAWLALDVPQQLRSHAKWQDAHEPDIARRRVHELPGAPGGGGAA